MPLNEPPMPQHIDLETRAAMFDWTPEEDKLLFQLGRAYSLNWQLIAEVFNGQTVRVPTDHRLPWDVCDRWNQLYGPSAVAKSAALAEANAAAGSSTSALTTPATSAAAQAPKPPKRFDSKKQARHKAQNTAVRSLQRKREQQVKPVVGAVRKVTLSAHESHAMIQRPMLSALEMSQLKGERDRQAQAQALRHQQLAQAHQMQQQQAAREAQAAQQAARAAAMQQQQQAANGNGNGAGAPRMQLPPGLANGIGGPMPPMSPGAAQSFPAPGAAISNLTDLQQRASSPSVDTADVGRRAARSAGAATRQYQLRAGAPGRSASRVGRSCRCAAVQPSAGRGRRRRGAGSGAAAPHPTPVRRLGRRAEPEPVLSAPADACAVES